MYSPQIKKVEVVVIKIENDKFYLTKYPGPLPKGRIKYILK